MKKVLLLNAGHTEEPLIKELKQLGVYLITSGNRPDLPGHKEADQYIQADYSDKDAILEIVKEENIDGIVSCAHDYGMVTASYVAEQMGWKGHDSLKNTMLLHEKDQFKELCVKLGIRSPLSTCFEEEKDAVDFLDGVEYPIICKAVDQTSGVGICRADNRAEAIEAIHNSFEKSRMKRIVIEPFIIGNQESFVAFVVNKKVVSCTACNCYSPINPYLIQTETMPSNHFSEVRDELIGITEKLFRELDLVDGLITIQYIVKDSKPYVIETMRRCLGNRFLTPVTEVTGFPFHKALVMAELGMDCSDLKAEEPMAKYAGHHAIMADRNGKYMGTEIPDDIMSHVFEYVELYSKGEMLEKYLSERLGYIYYQYDTPEEIHQAAMTFNERIKIILE